MWSLLTKRCFLRDYGDEDRDSFVRLNTHAEAREHLGGPLTEEDAQQLFENSLRDTDPRQGVRWAVFARKSNEYLGHLFFIPWENGWDMEMGIILKPDHLGKGLEEEVAVATLEYLFSEKPVQRVVATVGTKHGAMIGLLKTLGMQCVERCQDERGYYYIYALRKAAFVADRLAVPVG